MSSFLDELWGILSCMDHAPWSAEHKALAAEVHEKWERFSASLSDAQRAAYSEYESAENELFSIHEKLAFIRGVRFSAGFLWDSLRP